MGLEGRTCKECLFYCTDFGKPYYCLMRELYVFREEDDLACEDFKFDK